MYKYNPILLRLPKPKGKLSKMLRQKKILLRSCAMVLVLNSSSVHFFGDKKM